MSTNDLDRTPENMQKVTQRLKYFKVGIVSFLIVLLCAFVFQAGRFKTCNEAGGMFADGECVGIIEIGVIRFCQQSGEEYICSTAKVDKPLEFCEKFAKYVET